MASLVGVILLFRYGMPYRVRTEGETYLVLNGPLDQREIKADRRYDRWGKLGLVHDRARDDCPDRSAVFVSTPLAARAAGAHDLAAIGRELDAPRREGAPAGSVGARVRDRSVIGWSHARTTLVVRLKAASGRRCDMPDPNSVPLVHCSNCQALYQVVKAQAGPETVDLEIACRVCNGPLTAREGQFVLKYFLLREASRLDVKRAKQGSLRAKGGRSRPR